MDRPAESAQSEDVAAEVESAQLWPGLQIMAEGAQQAAALLRLNGTAGKAGILPQLHFDESEDSAFPRQDIDLAHLRTPVALEDAVALAA